MRWSATDVRAKRCTQVRYVVSVNVQWGTMERLSWVTVRTIIMNVAAIPSIWCDKWICRNDGRVLLKNWVYVVLTGDFRSKGASDQRLSRPGSNSGAQTSGYEGKLTAGKETQEGNIWVLTVVQDVEIDGLDWENFDLGSRWIKCFKFISKMWF